MKKGKSKELTLVERLQQQKPGYVGVATADTGRYVDFIQAFDQVRFPPNTPFKRVKGLSVAANYNVLVRSMLALDAEWLWIMDDDHIFPPDILCNLLERDVDIVTPLYLRRVLPFHPVLLGDESRDYPRYDFEWLKGKSGLIDVTPDATLPTGGMLIKRHVLEAMDDPWFETGQINSEYGSWDIWFTEKARKAGFSLFLDLDNTMGHIVPLSVVPIKDDKGNWGFDIQQPYEEEEYQ